MEIVFVKVKFFELAAKISQKAEHHSHKMSCVIIKKNRIVSVGWNAIKTSPKSLARFNMLHAEIKALLSNKFEDLKGCTAYIYRANKNGELALAKPCVGCFEALKLAGIIKICYTVQNGYKEEYLE